MTLVEILRFFSDTPGLPEKIQNELNEYECVMNYEYIPGVVRFIKEIRSHGVKTAVVTSSNTLKMENVYRAHPEFKSLFDRILTAENFKYSKPDPDCYLLGAKVFDTTPENCFVFEDSFNGLEAGNRAEMCVIGLSTTNPANLIADKARIVIPDFENAYKKSGSVGLAIPGVEIKIDQPDEDGIGEILIKGANVMMGYYNMPEETAEVIKDGWLHSGDLGFMDPDGWLYITGRSRNIIVTKTGKNIYPEEIEAVIRNLDYVVDCMVYGVKEKNEEEYRITVQIFPDYEALEKAKGNMTDDEIFELFKEEIYQMNRKLASYKRVKDIIIRKTDFVRTTTRKIKRQENI